MGIVVDRFIFIEVGEVPFIGPDSVHDAMEKVKLIRYRLKILEFKEVLFRFTEKAIRVPS